MAKEALKWAILIEPDDLRPRVELVRTHLEAGDRAAAARALKDAERSFEGDSAEIEALRELLEVPADGAASAG